MTKILKAPIYLFLWTIFMHIMWQWLEYGFYGEIQHRKVDDVVSILWMCWSWVMYYMGKNSYEMRTKSWIPFPSGCFKCTGCSHPNKSETDFCPECGAFMKGRWLNG